MQYKLDNKRNTYKKEQNKNIQLKYKQLFIEIPNLDKKLKHIQKYKLHSKTYNNIITPMHEYSIENGEIFNITKKPIMSYSKKLEYYENEIQVYINEFTKHKRQQISHIENNNRIVRVKKTEFKLNKKSNVKFIIENYIVLQDNYNEDSMNFDIDDNTILTNYYFTLENGTSETSHFIIEDIYAFLKELN